jgi:hypothetical protein
MTDDAKIKKRIFRTAAAGHISIELYSNSGFAPLKNLKYRIHIGSDHVLEGTTDDQGSVQHDNVPVGEYSMELEGYEGHIKIHSLPEGIDREPVRVPGYMLFHEDPEYSEPEDETDYDDEILLGDLEDHLLADDPQAGESVVENDRGKGTN